MTVNTTAVTSGPYTGNGVASSFSYGFPVEEKTELKVYETTDAGVETLLTVDTNYTVNDVGDDNGGTITRAAGALPSGYKWFIISDYPETQLTAFTSQGGFFSDLHEKAFDKLTRLVQQILRRFDRTLMVSESYTGDPLTLDTPDGGKVLRWKSDESGVENFDTEAAYVNVDGDTMTSPLAGPVSTGGDEYMPQSQVTDVIDLRVSSVPGFDPNNFQDYGLISATVGDANDYGGI